MYTHVCIHTSTQHVGDGTPLLKKGDYATLYSESERQNTMSGRAYIFKEDMKCWYDVTLFLPLPPPMVKTQYVAVSETLKETILEPILN